LHKKHQIVKDIKHGSKKVFFRKNLKNMKFFNNLGTGTQIHGFFLEKACSNHKRLSFFEESLL